MSDRKVVKTGTQAREATKNAVSFMGNVVTSTLGPGGSNAIIDRDREDFPPLIINDGVSIADQLYMEDECEHQVLRSMYEIAKKTNDEAGDGTTTSIALGQAITEAALEVLPDGEIAVPSGYQPMPLAKQIESEVSEVVKHLDKMAEKCDTVEKLKDVAFSSLENREIGDVVAEAVYEVGPDGYVTLEESFTGKVESEVVKGMKIYGKYAAEYQITNDRTKECVVNKFPVIVSNATVSSTSELANLVDDMNAKRTQDYTGMVVIAAKFEANAIRQAWTLYQNSLQKGAAFRFVFVKVPSLTPEELEDVAAYLDAKFIDCDTKMGQSLTKAKFEDLGYCEKMAIGADETVLIGGRGETADMTDGEAKGTRVEFQISKIKDQIAAETDTVFKKKKERRLGILSGGVGVIKVGARTQTEKVYLKYKIEDAINACQKAYQEGVVPGGGIALQMISEMKFCKDFFIREALGAPNRIIKKNAGGTLEIPDTIIDPVKVTKAALTNAASVAKTVITNSTIIAYKRRNVDEELRDMLTPQQQ